MNKKTKFTEDDVAEVIINYCKDLHVVDFRKCGVKGVPDLYVTNKYGHQGIWLELKVRDNNLDDLQKRFKKDHLGYELVVMSEDRILVDGPEVYNYEFEFNHIFEQINKHIFNK